MKNLKNNRKGLLSVGIVFLVLALGFYVSGNLVMGSSFLPTGLVFTIIGISGGINKPK